MNADTSEPVTVRGRGLSWKCPFPSNCQIYADGHPVTRAIAATADTELQGHPSRPQPAYCMRPYVPI